MIASCKSTYCKNAALNKIVCINDDSIVNMLHADQYVLYDPSLKILYKSIENHIISTALSMNKVVLIDRALNLSKKSRQRWIALANSFDVKIELIKTKIELPEIHAERRMKSDPRGHDFEYWKRVAEEHFQNYVAPSLEEGFSEIHEISFDEIKSGKVFL